MFIFFDVYVSCVDRWRAVDILAYIDQNAGDVELFHGNHLWAERVGYRLWEKFYLVDKKKFVAQEVLLFVERPCDVGDPIKVLVVECVAWYG